MHLYTVEQAKPSDLTEVEEWFVSGLSEHYGGDHAAHLDRLSRAYSNSGQDANPFNSVKQVGLIARENSTRKVVGFLNFALKRYGTAKVGPMIIDPTRRGEGVARTLMQHAPSSIRLMYCTVSAQNYTARNFLAMSGFTEVGRTRDQYCRGHEEVLVQRVVGTPADARQGPLSLHRVTNDSLHATYLTAARSYENNQGLPETVQVSYSGYKSNRDPISLKAKTSYVLADSGKEPIAGAMMTPKKGGSTKIAHMFWRDAEALDALLERIVNTEEAQETDGCVYVHVDTNATTLRVLNGQNWQLEALIPGLTAPESVTGHWSFRTWAQVSTTHKSPISNTNEDPWTAYHRSLRKVVYERGWHELETRISLFLSLIEEVGELGTELRNLEVGRLDALAQRKISHEIVDVYNYLMRLAWNLEIDLVERAHEKLQIVEKRYPVALSKGSTRKYTELHE